jgi:hypothetical protein
MAGTLRSVVGVLAFLALVSSADAFGRLAFSRGSSSSYAAPSAGAWIIPDYCLPLPGPRVIPVPDAKPMPFANPTPAPPSPTGEPPIQKKTAIDPRMPIIVTSHALSGSMPPGAALLPKDRVRVGFWNLAGRDVTVTIDGKSHALAKNRAVTLDLGRQFAWQVANQPQHVERIPEGQQSHEVVIRE